MLNKKSFIRPLKYPAFHKLFFSARFTLLELLVVIAIMVLLAGLLMPALKNAKDSSRRMVCASQLKQLSYLQVAYMDNYDGGLSPVIDYSGGGIYGWSVVLFRAGLLPTEKLLCCPSQPELIYSTTTIPSMGIVHQYHNQYGESLWAAGNIDTTGKRTNKPLSRQTALSSFIIMIDIERDRVNDANNYCFYDLSTYSSRYGIRHSGGCNILWGDMHLSYSHSPLEYCTNEFLKR